MLSSYAYLLKKNRIPGQVVIQITDHCNARCPQCGMRKTNKYQRHTLSIREIKGILDAAARRHVRAVSFTGGEPMLFTDQLVKLCDYAGKIGLDYIRTGTNGFVFMGATKPDFDTRINRLAERLAQTPIRNFWISIDASAPEIHEQMRGFPGVIKGIERALPIFHAHGIYPSANLGINRNVVYGIETRSNKNGSNPDTNSPETFLRKYKTGLHAFYRFVIDLGFTMVNTCYPMSIDTRHNANELNPVYAASSQDAIVRFSHHEKTLLFRALLETIPRYRSQIRIFSPLTALYALMRHYSNDPEASYPCRGGIDFFFINAQDGNTYPCGYRGDDNWGKYPRFELPPNNSVPNCRLCDWECFRDPSELLGPLLQLRSNPLALLSKLRQDPLFFRHWLKDLRYYRACRFFDSRQPPDYKRMSKFAPRTS